jgi:hypothetical protein
MIEASPFMSEHFRGFGGPLLQVWISRDQKFGFGSLFGVCKMESGHELHSHYEGHVNTMESSASGESCLESALLINTPQCRH